MNANQLIDSKWMVSAEFGTRNIPKEPTVTIASVTREAQDKDGKDVWPILYFTEPFAKPLKINRHSQRCCIAMFGTETDNWIGKRLSLYAQSGTYFGEKGTAVRIKGSPDLQQPISVSVKKRGSKNPDVYNLVPTGAARQSSGPTPSAPPKSAAPPKAEAPKVEQPKSEAPAAQPPPADSAPPKADEPPPAPAADVKGPRFGFGPHKGQPIERAEKSAILATIQFGEEKIAADPTATWVGKVREEIAALRLELERRMKIGSGTGDMKPPREPGSDDGDDEAAPPWLS